MCKLGSTLFEHVPNNIFESMTSNSCSGLSLIIKKMRIEIIVIVAVIKPRASAATAQLPTAHLPCQGPRPGKRRRGPIDV